MDRTMNGKKARAIRKAARSATQGMPYREHKVVKTKRMVANVRGADGKLRPQQIEHRTFGLIDDCIRKHIKMLKRAA